MPATTPQDPLRKPTAGRDENAPTVPPSGAATPEEKPDESAIESLGRAVSAPVLGGAGPDEREQTGGR